MTNAETKIYQQWQKIQRDNEQFGVMTKAQKRVKIAQDAILWNKTNAFDPQTSFAYIDDDFYDNIEKDSQFHNIVLDNEKLGVSTCSGCALGGLLYAKAMRFNHVCIEMNEDYVNFDDDSFNTTCPIEIDQQVSIGFLEDIFSPKQLGMIESAFEEKDMDAEKLSTLEDINKCIYYEPYIREDRERFEAIMQNIIDNKGTFKPGTFKP